MSTLDLSFESIPIWLTTRGCTRRGGLLTLADRSMISVYMILAYAPAVPAGQAAISNEERLKLVKRD